MLKTTTVLLTLLFLLLSQNSRAEDFIQQSDKQKHFAMSAGLSLGSYTYFREVGNSKTKSYLKAFLFSMGIGLSKELFLDDEVDRGDLGADLLGIGSGFTIPLFWEF